jgi:hypothetical protein
VSTVHEITLRMAALDSLETIMFGDCRSRSSDELEAQASELVRLVSEASRFFLDHPALSATEGME